MPKAVSSHVCGYRSSTRSSKGKRNLLCDFTPREAAEDTGGFVSILAHRGPEIINGSHSELEPVPHEEGWH